MVFTLQLEVLKKYKVIQVVQLPVSKHAIFHRLWCLYLLRLRQLYMLVITLVILGRVFSCMLFC